MASAEMTVFIRFSAVFFRLKGAGVFFGHLLYTAYKSLVLGMLYDNGEHPPIEIKTQSLRFTEGEGEAAGCDDADERLLGLKYSEGENIYPKIY